MMTEETRSVRILVGGDVIFGGKCAPRVFTGAKDLLSGADIAIYNQEHPMTMHEQVYATKRFGTTDVCDPVNAKAIADAGFTCATLATNHILNRGSEGIKDTIGILADYGIQTVGAGADLREASRTKVIAAHGKSIAIINACEHEYCIATHKKAGANPLDLVAIARQVLEARAQADAVLVILHGGLEYSEYPLPRQIIVSRYLAEQGASSVLWHHSHYFAGHEVYRGCPIFYGLGNLVADKGLMKWRKDPYANVGLIAEIAVAKDNSVESKYHFCQFDRVHRRVEIIATEACGEYRKRMDEIGKAIGEGEEYETFFADRVLNQALVQRYMRMLVGASPLVERLAKRLRLNGLLRWLTSRRLKMTLARTASWNMVRCETHRDVLELIYDRYVDRREV